MPQDLPYRTLGFLLHDAARLLRKRFEQKARAHGSNLTRAQWSVLAHLSRQEGINQTTLADILDVEPITVARLVDKLEQLGLIERRADPGDRRARLLYLQPAAAPLLAEMREVGAAAREDAMRGLSPEQREQLIEMLLLIKNNLAERDGRDDRDDRQEKVA
ncbi:MarR family winged helix-turn-helix transcriptional regulator [Ferrovibrio xuzhouensis]|uniref:MarR family winged helix-turn-helix transcriptional regulator n=1 Tax=Ferrovibrio xuzhouensis TaxID=1576914 RepID=A0ABV7VGD6_9PROT